MALGKLGTPIGQTRIVYAIIMSVPIAIFMYLAIVNQNWLSLSRVGYLVFGVAAGALLATLEVRVVLSKLAKNSEALVWEVPLAGAVLFLAPFLFVLSVSGTAEYAPFGLFAFFPFMIADLAVSGIGFRRYDKSNEVLVYGFVYGYKYWVQPNPSSDDQFRYFISAVAEKDASLLWSYIGYSNGFYRKLERQPISDGQTQKELLKLLAVMKKYRAIALTHFAATMILTPISFALLFKYFHSTIFGMEFVDVLMPLMFLLWVSLGINTFVSMRMVKKAGAKAMAVIDSTKLSLTH